MRRLIYITIVTLGVGSALVALFLLSQTSQNTEEFDRLHITMLMINVGGVLVLFALTAGNLSRLFRDYRNRVPGARLKARMVGMFVGLAILPLLVVFYFSMQFINRGIDSWFNIEVEAGLDDALALSRAALEMLMRDHLETTVSINNRLRQVAPRQLIYELSLLRRESGAREQSFPHSAQHLHEPCPRDPGENPQLERRRRHLPTLPPEETPDRRLRHEPFGRQEERVVPTSGDRVQAPGVEPFAVGRLVAVAAVRHR